MIFLCRSVLAIIFSILALLIDVKDGFYLFIVVNDLVVLRDDKTIVVHFNEVVKHFERLLLFDNFHEFLPLRFDVILRKQKYQHY